MNDLDLEIIATRLEGLEETIIAKFIDRAQFSANLRIYERGKSGFEGEPKRSLYELRLLYQERMDARFGRFCVPEERPFSSRLPESRREVHLPDTGLRIDSFNRVNLTRRITELYRTLIPRLCRAGEDGHFGSSVEHDVYAVQAIARRVHYGAFYVGESKYRKSKNDYAPLIESVDRNGLLRKLTRPHVEERIMARVRDKVLDMQRTINRAVRHAIDPETVVDFYRETIIPLTKEGQIDYLLYRSRGV